MSEHAEARFESDASLESHLQVLLELIESTHERVRDDSTFEALREVLESAHEGVKAQLRAILMARDPEARGRIVAAVDDITANPPPLDPPGFFERRLASLERT